MIFVCCNNCQIYKFLLEFDGNFEYGIIFMLFLIKLFHYINTGTELLFIHQSSEMMYFSEMMYVSEKCTFIKCSLYI